MAKNGKLLSELVADIGYKENGFGYITDEHGTTLAYPVLDYVFMEMNPIVAAQQDDTDTFHKFSYDGGKSNKGCNR